MTVLTQQATSTHVRQVTAALLVVLGVGALAAGLFLLAKRQAPVPRSQSISIAVTFPAPDIEIIDRPGSSDKQSVVTLQGASRSLREVGQPQLPTVRKIVLLPAGARVQSVHLEPFKQSAQALGALVAPAQPPPSPTTVTSVETQATSPLTVAPAEPDPAIYGTSAAFPADPIAKIAPDQWGPYDVVVVDLVPFAYRPKENTLTSIESAQLVVSYMPSTKPPDRRQYFRPDIFATAQQTVANPEQLTDWYGELEVQYAKATTSTTPIDLAIIRPNFLWPKLGIQPSARAIFALSPTQVWLAGENHAFNNNQPIAYFDGSTWTRGYVSTGMEIAGLDGLPDGTVVAVGGDFAASLAVHRAEEAPVAFQSVGLPPIPGQQPNSLLDIDIALPNIGWAVGTYNQNTQGLILKALPSTPAFTNWQKVDVFGNTKRLSAVYVADASHVWGAGESGTIYFFNGTTWVSQPSGVTAWIRDLDGTGPNDVWAVGDAGTILRFNGSSWQNLTSTNPDRRVASRSDLTEVEAIDTDTVWVSGNPERPLLQWHQPSQTWIPSYFRGGDNNYQFGDDNYDVRDLFALDPTHVYLTRHGDLSVTDPAPDLLTDYIAYRSAQGYQIEVRTLGELWSSSFRTDYQGIGDVTYTLRAYLQDRYLNNELRYALLAGSADALQSGVGGIYGTDSLYRDVIGPGGTDGVNDLFVSRIPRDDPADVHLYLDRIPAYETRTDVYRSNALLTAALVDTAPGVCGIGTQTLEAIRTDVLEPRGFSVRTIYAEDGVIDPGPPEVTIRDLVRQRWPTERPYVVSIHGHGGPGNIMNQLRWDDFDLFDPQYPAHVAVPGSCSTADPSFYNNFGYALGRGAQSYVGGVQEVWCNAEIGIESYLEHILDDRQTPAEAFGQTPWASPKLTVYADPLLGPTPEPIRFLSPMAGSTYRGPQSIPIVGSVLGAGFSSYAIEWGIGATPATWSSVGVTLNTPTMRKVADLLGTWNNASITTTGTVTLRITGIYNGQPKSHQIGLTIDNQQCSDGTAPQACSIARPQFCENGQLVNRCQTCGCPNTGDTCMPNGSCFLGCSDGTPRSTCSASVGVYCSSTSTLIPLVTNCASEDGVAHTADDCNFCGVSDGMFCRTDGVCATPRTDRGLRGDYYQGDNFETLANADVLDPVIDFGPHFSGSSPYFGSLLARSDRANTTGAASVRWDGFLNIPTADPITYYLNCAGTCRLYLDNMRTPRISETNWLGTASVALSPGWRRIRVEYQRPASLLGNPGLQLGWRITGSPCMPPLGGTFPLSLRCVIPHDTLASEISRSGPGGGQQVTP